MCTYKTNKGAGTMQKENKKSLKKNKKRLDFLNKIAYIVLS